MHKYLIAIYYIAAPLHKMVTSEFKEFCVLEFAKSESAISVKRAFYLKFYSPSCHKNTHSWRGYCFY